MYFLLFAAVATAVKSTPRVLEQFSTYNLPFDKCHYLPFISQSEKHKCTQKFNFINTLNTFMLGQIADKIKEDIIWCYSYFSVLYMNKNLAASQKEQEL